MLVLNIVKITYGRGIGYVFEEELFENSITDISATKFAKRCDNKASLSKFRKKSA